MSKTRTIFIPDSDTRISSVRPSIAIWKPAAPGTSRPANVVEKLDSGSNDELDWTLLEDSTLELDSNCALLELSSLELDPSDELLDSGAELLDETRTNSQFSTATVESRTKHTFVSGSTMPKRPASTTELSHASTGESFVTSRLQGNGSSFCRAPPPWLM